MPYTPKYITLQNNKKISFIEEGNTPQTLLFIHGMGCNAMFWSEMIKDLKKDFRCIAIDLPEHGNSSKTQTDFTLTEFVEIVHEFILSLEIDKNNIHLVGHSMGAQISIILSIRFPTLFQSLVLLAPAGVENFSEKEKLIIKASTNFLPMFNAEEQMKNMMMNSWFNKNNQRLNSFLQSISSSNDFSFKHYFNTIKNSILAMLNEPVDNFLSAIHIPCLIVFGSDDKMIPNPLTKRTKTIEVAKKAQKSISNSTLIILDEKGHFLPMEAVNECCKELRKFIFV